MGIRERRGSDTGTLTEILLRLGSEGYPPHRPGGLGAFVPADNEIVSRVYDMDGVVVGHVAVHDYTARSVMEAASEAAGVPARELAAVARLFVEPGVRRAGIGRRLLDTAAAVSCELGRRPVLDVWERFEAAVALYESAGWDRAGLVDIQFRSPCSAACVHDGDGIRSFVFVGPGPAAPSRS